LEGETEFEWERRIITFKREKKKLLVAGGPPKQPKKPYQTRRRPGREGSRGRLAGGHVRTTL